MKFVLLTAAFYVSLAVRLIVCGRLAAKGWATKLPCFFLFCLVSCAQSVLVWWNVSDPWNMGSPKIQDALAWAHVMAVFGPWMPVLQIVAGLEAYRWFVFSLPKFRAPGLWILAIAGSGVGIMQFLGSPSSPVLEGALKSLPKMEWVVGFWLGLVLLLAISIFKIFDEVPKCAYAHAFCLAGLSIGNAIGWQLLSRRMIAASVIIAFTAWLITVTECPLWREPTPEKYDGTAERALKALTDEINQKRPKIRRQVAGQ